MSRCDFRPAAEADLEEIAAYVAQHSPANAKRAERSVPPARPAFLPAVIASDQRERGNLVVRSLTLEIAASLRSSQ